MFIASLPMKDESAISAAFDLAQPRGLITPAFQPIVHLDSGVIRVSRFSPVGPTSPLA